MALGPILAHCSVAAPRLINIEWNPTQDSQSIVLGLGLTAAPQLVAPGRSRFRYRRGRGTNVIINEPPNKSSCGLANQLTYA